MTTFQEIGEEWNAHCEHSLVLVKQEAEKEQKEEEREPVFTNFDEIGENRHKVPLLFDVILTFLLTLTLNWPKGYQGKLFVRGSAGKPRYLDSPIKLFAWFDEQFHVDWAKGQGFIPESRFYESLLNHVEEYEAIERFPHFPPLAGVYYMTDELPQSDGSALEKLIDFFSPNTPEDRQLIKALILTLLWGGPSGSRPAFLITGPDRDPTPERQGRGLGKTTLATLLSELVGGPMSFSSHEEVGRIKKRLLSPEAAKYRVALLDNLKTRRLSWAELEDLITAAKISGHRLYQGEGQRPNTLVWVLTLNGASLSKDMAERCIVIKLARPQHDPDWERKVRNYLHDHRGDIISDIRQLLEQPSVEKKGEKGFSRWAEWEAQVLCKVEDFEACQTIIRDRQQDVDDDSQEANLIRDQLQQKLRQGDYDPLTCCVSLDCRTLSRWLSDWLNKPLAPTKVTPYLTNLHIQEIDRKRCSAGAQWIWRGVASPLNQKPVPYYRQEEPDGIVTALCFHKSLLDYNLWK
ncbi:Hypothetical protein PBC10988_4790 [Planctomycetales bacterium 10988]|nr:Hypothetical protein PBC10988_4790 [Planctomycetales bacterium 10988]